MRVGFVGGHLREHVVERFFAAFITGLDPAAFERWVWSASDAGDARTEAIAAGVEHFAHGESTLEKLAADIRAAELDVLVYLDVGLDARTGALAALRLAPIQAACCGHPVTTGLDSIDQFLSGKLLEPPGAQVQYREKLVRLPQLGSSPRAPSASGDGDWADALRLEGKPLLMCLQNLAKLPPSFDDVLAAILARSGARLVLFDRGGGTSARWRKRVDRALSTQGVSVDMLRIEPLRAYGDFLAGIARADLVLDSPGFSGGATSLDALAMGAAVLCFEGASARARQTSAMLRMVEVPELIAGSAADYVERAVALLAEPQRVAVLRSNIRERANRLFETAPVVEAFADFLRSCRKRLT